MVEARLAGASKGLSLGTTLALAPIPGAGNLRGKGVLTLSGRNYSTAVVARYAINPYLTVLITADGNATFTDESADAQDDSTGTDVTLSSLPTSPTGYIYLGTAVPVRGYQADVDSANSTASAMTGDYWNGSAWAAASITDGTTSGGASFAVDGNITFTVPSAWAQDSLVKILGLTGRGPRGGTNAVLYEPLFWLRLSNSGAMDSSTTLNSLLPLNRSTVYAEIAASLPEQIVIHGGRRGVGCIEALTDAGTANLLLSVAGEFAA